jgi:hypothetical protein
MGRTNHTLENPAIGHRVTFPRTGEQTDGDLLSIEYIVTKHETKPLLY